MIYLNQHCIQVKLFTLLKIKLQNLTISDTFSFTLGGVSVFLKKFGKIIMCTIQHQGGIFNADLPSKTVPGTFRGEYSIYLSVPCITGSPYIALSTDGGIQFRINGATFQALTIDTTYFLTQSYISRFY